MRTVRPPQISGEIYKFFLSKYTPLITAWKNGKGTVGTTVPIPRFAEKDISELCTTATNLLKVQPPVIRVNPSVIVVGDLHGNLVNLIHILSQHGMPPNQKYLFLGNIVNFGEFSLETILLVLALFCSYPSSVSLIRGDAERYTVQILNSLHDEIKVAYHSIQILDCLLTVFSHLPIACLFGPTVLCTQSSTLIAYRTIKEMMMVKNPIPCETNAGGFAGYVANSTLPPQDVLDEFFDTNGIELLIVGGNVDETGVSPFCSERGFALSTCESTGAAGIMVVTGDLRPSPVVFVSNSQLTRENAVFEQVEKAIRRIPVHIASTSPGPAMMRNGATIVIPQSKPIRSSVFRPRSSTPKPTGHILDRAITPNPSIINGGN